MRMIAAMAILAVGAPFMYLFLVSRFPDSFFARYFIWMCLFLLLGIFFTHLFQRR
ncbi:hypothetical protein ACP6EK_09115 [Candidatus Caldatribacterium sp. SIUC1]|uniref:hypothetical protein n=1 Tax=Candidatus Caldatribacterium sp. SIUC1 TaxID=3418365 RepID=UPI003F691507